MKFSGNVSFINIMILSKFQVDCITLTNFGNFLNIGKFAISAKFQLTKNGCNSPKIDEMQKKIFWCLLTSYGRDLGGCDRILTIHPKNDPVPPTPI